MGKPPTPPEIAEEDVQEVLARAARLQAEARRKAVEDGTASIEEVQAVARELDIAPDHVEEAMRALRKEREQERRRKEEEEREQQLAAARRSARWKLAGLLGGGAVIFGGACMGMLALPESCSTSSSEALETPLAAVEAPVAEKSPAPVAEPAGIPAPVPSEASSPAPAAEAPAQEPLQEAPPAPMEAAAADVETPAGTPRRVKLSASKAQLLQRELEGAWELEAYLLRDEGRWMGVPVTRTLERWKFRRVGDFDHVMGEALTFSGNWKIQEGLEGFPLPWRGSEAFLLALENVVGLAGDLSRYKDWHVGVLQEGELALFYAGRGDSPRFGSVTQGHRFVRRVR